MRFTREKNHSINSCLIIKRRILDTSKKMQNQIGNKMSYCSSKLLISIILVLSLLVTYCDSRTITAQDPQIGLRNQPSQPLVLSDTENQNNHQQQHPLHHGQIQPRQKPLISATLQSNPTITNNKNQQQQQQQQSMPVINQFHHQQMLNLNSYKPRQQQFSGLPPHHHQHHHNHHQRAPVKLNEYCHLPEDLAPYTKCTNTLESNFNNTALAEFQSKLDETSLELRNLLHSYWNEFRTLSLDLVFLAKNSTLHKLAQQLITTSGPNQQVSNQQRYEATKVLFDAIYNHLAASAIASGASSVADFELLNSNSPNIQHHTDLASTTRLSPPIANINLEINAYFRRIYLIQAKKLLDQRLAYSSVRSGGVNSVASEVDLECLGGNLLTQQQVESILNELTNNTNLKLSSTNLVLPDLSSEQVKLSQSIKHSIEFTRSLISSLSLSSEIFNNLTHKSAEWMPHKSCHEALVKMTVCPTCYPVKQGSSRAQTLAADIPPCENYCLNVVNGCMNDIYELNRFWSEHVNALTKFKTNLIQMNNIENVMSNLDEKLVNFMTKLNQQYNSSNVVTTGSSSASINDQQQEQQAFDSTSVSAKVSKYNQV